jgi:dTDP-4-amino-4,6-dideoxygalactose transaminase
VVERRIAVGRQLTDLLAGLEGIRPAPVTAGAEHSVYLYPLRVEHWTAARFAAALAAEGAPASAGYTGEPIYLCMDALSGGRTFGQSAHPLDGCHGGRVLAYEPGLCPRAEEALRRVVTLGIHEGYSAEDVADVAGCVRKVVELLPRDE